MPGGKWISLGVGMVSTLAMGLLLLFFQPTARLTAEDVLVMLSSALTLGIALGLLHALVTTRYELDMRRLIVQIQAMGRHEGKSEPRPFKGWLSELARAYQQSSSQMEDRLERLVQQKRELEVQLRISEAERQHVEAILNSISDAVIVTDAFNEMALANESASRVLGFEVQQSIRRPVDEVLHDPLLVKLIKDTREGAPGAPGLRRHVEHRLMQNGHSAVYDVSLATVTNTQQAPPEPCGVVTILRDITREKEISEMKSDFVSAVSHELRTPLSSIKAYLEMLVDGEANDEQTRAEFYGIIQGEANRLGRLIDNILNISRIESGVVKVQREHISLPSLIKEAIDVMQPQARAKQIELAEVPTPLFFQVFADKDMIYQATLNLIGNAIKYTPSGGKVTVMINVDEHGRTVNVSVKDTGVGIPSDAMSHLFQKFFRVNEHKKLAKGTGLGLNLVKQIIETVHGGKVTVTSEPGKGSTFTYSLPMAENGY